MFLKDDIFNDDCDWMSNIIVGHGIYEPGRVWGKDEATGVGFPKLRGLWLDISDALDRSSLTYSTLARELAYPANSGYYRYSKYENFATSASVIRVCFYLRKYLKKNSITVCEHSFLDEFCSDICGGISFPSTTQFTHLSPREARDHFCNREAIAKLGQELKEIRHSLGVSLEDASGYLGVTKQSISYAERGGAPAGTRSLIYSGTPVKMALCFGIPFFKTYGIRGRETAMLVDSIVNVDVDL